MYTVSEILALAIQLEKNGEKFYREGLKRVSNPQMVSLLRRLAEEELKHIETFSEMKKRASGDQPFTDEAGQSILVGIVGDQTFSLKEENLETLGGPEELIQIALEFERDTILFFGFLRTLAQKDGAIKELDVIIEEENRHINLLEEMGAAGGGGGRKQ
ncbi:MAG: ferritin family protein [Proteobacteria bacterium]|nr:ferritin family protein [Pseudomonadota bacterium]